MLSPEQVAAVIVTRGDVDLSDIVESLPPFRETVIWDNSGKLMMWRPPHERDGWLVIDGGSLEAPIQDLAVYGRYAAIEHAAAPVIYVQDDDCVLAPEAFDALLAEYEPGKVVANMPPEFRHAFYAEHCLVGFGALFDRDLPERAFRRFRFESGIAQHEDFTRTCDVVFTALTPRKLVDVPYRNLEHATAPGRMYREQRHVGERQRMLELALKVRDA